MPCRSTRPRPRANNRQNPEMVVAHNDETRPVAIRTGNFELRLAESDAEIEAAQALRYRVFYEEMAAAPTAEMAAARRDFDAFDRHCDHLLVIDHRHGVGAAGVVGTYRLLRRSAAATAGRFYSADEFDISTLQAHPGEILELGRSCVGPDHRSRAVAQLLWRGIADYVLYHSITLMFGCASFRRTASITRPPLTGCRRSSRAICALARLSATALSWIRSFTPPTSVSSSRPTGRRAATTGTTRGTRRRT